MATRKQKHAAAVAKHEAFMKKYREDGLKALAEAQERRKRDEAEALAKVLSSKKLVNQVTTAAEGFRRIGKAVEKLTVGEFLDASNKMLPVFSDQ